MWGRSGIVNKEGNSCELFPGAVLVLTLLELSVTTGGYKEKAVQAAVKCALLEMLHVHSFVQHKS
jgi:hypothetical protein